MSRGTNDQIPWRKSPLAVGDTAPGFALSTPFGIEVSLTSRLMRGPVLIDFLRGSWDPNTRARLQLLTDYHERFEKASCSLVAVVCERTESLAHYLTEKPVSFPVVVDSDRRVSRAYGVWQRLSLPVWNIARPSSFLLDRCGYVVFSYVAPLQIHAADLGEILTRVDGLDASATSASGPEEL